MSRILGIIRRLSLKDHAEGWGDDCFITYRPATYKDYKSFRALSADMSEDEAIDYMYAFVREHCVEGQVMAYIDGNFQNTPFLPADIEDFDPDFVKETFALMAGKSNDPKASAEEAGDTSKPATAEPRTETP